VLLAGDLDANKAEAVLQAGIIGDKIRAALCEHYSLTFKFDGKTDVSVEHHCTASIGAVMFLGHQDSQVDLYKWADTAMYQAKKAGGNQIRFYMSDSSGNPATQASVREPIAEKRKAEVAK
jgi:GGDEF domain-containing protein